MTAVTYRKWLFMNKSLVVIQTISYDSSHLQKVIVYEQVTSGYLDCLLRQQSLTESGSVLSQVVCHNTYLHKSVFHHKWLLTQSFGRIFSGHSQKRDLLGLALVVESTFTQSGHSQEITCSWFCCILLVYPVSSVLFVCCCCCSGLLCLTFCVTTA